MGVFSSFKIGFGSWIHRIFGKKRAKIGLYGPPNAGKTTLANKIVKDWSGGTVGTVSALPHETRRAVRKEGVEVRSNGSSLQLDIVDTPGMATKIDFKEFMAHGMSEPEAKKRAKEATEGVIEAVKWLDDLDGILLVMDATEDPYTQVNVTVIGNMEARRLPLLIVANKIDLPEASPSRIKAAFPQHAMVAVSALEGKNIDELYQAIAANFG